MDRPLERAEGLNGVALCLGLLTAVGAAAVSTSSSPAVVPPTFADVAPILFSQCASCHRPGAIGAMSLLTFDEVRPWAKAIRAKVVSREMPPWGADPAYGRFRNARRLTDAQIATIVDWVDGGARRGPPLTVDPPTFPHTWTLGEPDFVIEMPVTFDLPAEGQIDLQDFFVPVTFPEDRFVEALEIRPSAAGVLHHGGAYVVDLPPGTRLVDGRAIGPDGRRLRRDQIRGVGESAFSTQGASKLVSFVPGRGFERHRPGAAKRIPAGKYIHFDMHYQPTGKPEQDRTALALWFSKTPVRHEVLTRSISSSTIIVEGRQAPVEVVMVNGEPRLTALIPNIPPYVDNWKMVTVLPFAEPATVYAFSPHMHLRGKDMTYVLTYPDGRDEVVLRVPKYDFNWQFHYELDTPLRVPAGSKMVAIAHFDNSTNNTYNPAPERYVFWGEQSWDEMDVPMIELSFDNDAAAVPHRRGS